MLLFQLSYESVEIVGRFLLPLLLLRDLAHLGEAGVCLRLFEGRFSVGTASLARMVTTGRRSLPFGAALALPADGRVLRLAALLGRKLSAGNRSSDQI